MSECKHEDVTVAQLEKEGYSVEHVLACSLCQQDYIQSLEIENRALKHNINYYQEQLDGIQGIIGIAKAKKFVAGRDVVLKQHTTTMIVEPEAYEVLPQSGSQRVLWLISGAWVPKGWLLPQIGEDV